MRKLYLILIAVAAVLVAAVVLMLWPTGKSQNLRVGLAPYQDLAMIVNAKPLGLEKKYGTEIDLITLPWEEILPSVATSGRGLDIGFASYAEYLTKYNNLNSGTADPVLFVYPLYVFKGGAFVTFKPDIPRLTNQTITDRPTITRVLGLKIGAQKKSVYEMMIYRLAALNGIDPASVQLIDTPLDQGFLAAQQGSLDIATAGLTQLTEAERRNGHIVLTMDDLRFADFTGFIVKKSTLEAREKDIKNVIRMWFDSVKFVYEDIDKNSEASLAYLNRQAATHYTLDEYKRALSQEYLPRSVSEADAEFVKDSGKFPVKDIRATNFDYLIRQGVIKTAPNVPGFITP